MFYSGLGRSTTLDWSGPSKTIQRLRLSQNSTLLSSDCIVSRRAIRPRGVRLPSSCRRGARSQRGVPREAPGTFVCSWNAGVAARGRLVAARRLAHHPPNLHFLHFDSKFIAFTSVPSICDPTATFHPCWPEIHYNHTKTIKNTWERAKSKSNESGFVRKIRTHQTPPNLNIACPQATQN